jgi:hypothetical protein
MKSARSQLEVGEYYGGSYGAAENPSPSPLQNPDQQEVFLCSNLFESLRLRDVIVRL